MRDANRKAMFAHLKGAINFNALKSGSMVKLSNSPRYFRPDMEDIFKDMASPNPQIGIGPGAGIAGGSQNNYYSKKTKR